LFACPWKDQWNIFAAAGEEDAAGAEVVGWVVAGSDVVAGLAAGVGDAAAVLREVDVAGIAVAQLFIISTAVTSITSKMSVPFFISPPFAVNIVTERKDWLPLCCCSFAKSHPWSCYSSVFGDVGTIARRAG
jgi:hypothetical protein